MGSQYIGFCIHPVSVKPCIKFLVGVAHIVFDESGGALGAVDVVDAYAAVGAPVACGTPPIHVVTVHMYPLFYVLIRVGFICVWG